MYTDESFNTEESIEALCPWLPSPIAFPRFFLGDDLGPVLTGDDFKSY